MRAIFSLLAMGVALSPLHAQTIPAPEASAQGQVAVTIYNNDLALVQDRRELVLPAGRSRQEFPDVSARIRAETVTLTGTGLGIVEQNFDYDLLSPQALMQKAVGETITIVRTNPATGGETRERARVLAANGGVVLQIGERIEVLRDDGLPVRVIFDKVPEGLRPRPTLSVTLSAPRGGRQPVTLTYLTPGLAWDADYVALFDESRGTMDVQGWITLNNQSGTPYRNARVLLVAGTAASERDSVRSNRFVPQRPAGPDGPLRRAGVETSERERLGDFYLYPLAERTTIAQAQQKQVSFLEVAGTPARRVYEFRNPWLGTSNEPVSAARVLRFSTSRDQGLGDALPAGTVRFYQRDARGNPQFVGEREIGHTPMGSELGLAIGDAFDVKVQPIVEKREEIRRPDDNWWRTTMRYELSNARPQPVTVTLIQSGLWGETRIISQSLPGDRLNADENVWHVTVPANGRATVAAVFESRI